jgi:hypothetical protein
VGDDQALEKGEDLKDIMKNKSQIFFFLLLIIFIYLFVSLLNQVVQARVELREMYGSHSFNGWGFPEWSDLLYCLIFSAYFQV